MARNSPLTIWTIKHTPSSDPKFHIVEILDGVGNSTKELLTIFNNLWLLTIEINVFTTKPVKQIEYYFF